MVMSGISHVVLILLVVISFFNPRANIIQESHLV